MIQCTIKGVAQQVIFFSHTFSILGERERESARMEKIALWTLKVGGIRHEKTVHCQTHKTVQRIRERYKQWSGCWIRPSIKRVYGSKETWEGISICSLLQKKMLVHVCTQRILHEPLDCLAKKAEISFQCRALAFSRRSCRSICISC